MMKILKRKNADLNMQWVMWIAILFAVMAALIIFKDQILGFITQGGSEVQNMTNNITGKTSGL